MIIVEGVDKAGKSTLIKELETDFEFEVKKFGIPVGDPIPGYISELQRVTEPTIYDRFIYGEIPYSIVKKRERFMKKLELTVLDLMVQSFPHIVLYVRPERKVILDRIMALGDAYISENEAMRIYEEYDEMFWHVNSNVMTVNSDTPYNKIRDAIFDIDRVDKWDKYNTVRALKMEGIGTLNPKYLFISERYNANAPYQVTLCSPCGAYLFDVLEKANVKLTECHFVNAINKDLKQLPIEYIEALNPEKIIALGEIADHVANVYKKPYSRIPHPAYWSRFHANKTDEYVKMVTSACLS